MTLKEAIESGKRFRHKYYGEDVWERPNGEMKIPVGITWEQVVSNDWIVEEKVVSISESEFNSKIYDYFHSSSSDRKYSELMSDLKDLFFND